LVAFFVAFDFISRIFDEYRYIDVRPIGALSYEISLLHSLYQKPPTIPSYGIAAEKIVLGVPPKVLVRNKPLDSLRAKLTQFPPPFHC
jgi:hypothetical protein